MRTVSRPGVAHYLGVLKRRRWQLIVPALVVFLGAIGVASVLPPVYRASAKVLIEQPAPRSGSADTVRAGTIAERLAIATEHAMTRRKLEQIIERFDLYPEQRRRTSLAAAADAMRDDIGIALLSPEEVEGRGTGGEKGPSANAVAFALSYENRSPELAQKVAEELVVALYVNAAPENAEGAGATPERLAADSAALSERIAALDGQLERFKERHAGSLPEQLQLNQQLLQRADENHEANERALRVLEERKVYLTSQLGKVDPYATPAVADGQPASPAEQLRELESRYAIVSARYSKNHPDRVALERQIESLRREVQGAEAPNPNLEQLLASQRAELEKLRQRYTDRHPDVVKLQRAMAATEKQIAEAPPADAPADSDGKVVANPTNPLYLQLQAQLQAVEAETASRLEQREKLLQELIDLEQRIGAAPKVEREYRELLRERELAGNEQRELNAMQPDAGATNSREGERQWERFTLLEPPALPSAPVRPNRPAIALLGLLLGLITGIGNVAVREMRDHTVRGTRGVVAVLGAPPIAVVPYIPVPGERDARRRRRA